MAKDSCAQALCKLDFPPPYAVDYNVIMSAIHTPSTNLADELARQSKYRSNKIAVYLRDTQITFGHLDLMTWRSTALLFDGGVHPGHVVAMTIADELTLIVSILAIARLGATVLSLPRRMPALRRQELAAQTNARFLLTDIADLSDGGLTKLVIDRRTISNAAWQVDYSLRDECPQSPWVIVTGSGSTGRPKLMPVSHEQQIARLEVSKQWLPASPDDRVATLSHLNYYAPRYRYLESLSVGASFVLDRVEPRSMCKKHRVTIMHATVFHVEQLLNVASDDSHKILDNLRVLSIGSSTVSADLRERISRRLTENLYVRYATNESGPLAVASQPDVFRIPESVGKPIPGVDIEIIDPYGAVLPVGKTGMIRTKSPGTISQYLGDREATQESFVNQWFHTGDLGKFSSDMMRRMETQRHGGHRGRGCTIALCPPCLCVLKNVRHGRFRQRPYASLVLCDS